LTKTEAGLPSPRPVDKFNDPLKLIPAGDIDTLAQARQTVGMNLYLIRHAHAVTAEDDPARPLSRKGRGQVRRLARFLRRSGALRGVTFWHSPLDRARETATLLADHLQSDNPLKSIPRLLTEGTPAELAARLANRRADLALVGHEPTLGDLATLLVCGQSESGRFVMAKSGVIALEREHGRWSVRWHLAPELLG
jgi:phosphohistidine phosphatase